VLYRASISELFPDDGNYPSFWRRSIRLVRPVLPNPIQGPPGPVHPQGCREWRLWGHEDQFLPPRTSARCGFGKETFAGRRWNGRDAPRTDLPALGAKLASPTQSGSAIYGRFVPTRASFAAAKRLENSSKICHSMMRSARFSSSAGMVKPSVSAVLRLITSWCFANTSIAVSAGLAPLMILST
jgi:hypothetical protein